MNELQLSDDQIVELIFEKKILLDNNLISVKSSCFSILSKLDEKLSEKKIFNRKDQSYFAKKREKKIEKTIINI